MPWPKPLTMELRRGRKRTKSKLENVIPPPTIRHSTVGEIFWQKVRTARGIWKVCGFLTTYCEYLPYNPRHFSPNIRWFGGDLDRAEKQQGISSKMLLNSPPFGGTVVASSSSHVIVATLFNMSKQWKIRDDNKKIYIYRESILGNRNIRLASDTLISFLLADSIFGVI